MANLKVGKQSLEGKQKSILSPRCMFIDKTEIEYRFKRSVESYDENAHVQKAVIQKLMALLRTYCPIPTGRILEVGCGTGLLTTLLQQQYTGNELFINDLVDKMCSKTASHCQLPSQHCMVGDIERIELRGEYDLIVSASTFQWFAHPEETFRRLAARIRRGGWLVFSTFGKDNFKELKALTGSGLNYYSLAEMKGLLSSCLEILYMEEEQYILEFNDALEVLQHVKKTGVNATPSQPGWTRGRLESFKQEYTRHFTSSGKYLLTYHPQYFICRKS